MSAYYVTGLKMMFVGVAMLTMSTWILLFHGAYLVGRKCGLRSFGPEMEARMWKLTHFFKWVLLVALLYNLFVWFFMTPPFPRG